MMKRILFFVILLVFCANFLPAETKIAYVKQAGSDAWAGRANVFTSIKSAFAGNFDEVWITEGVYQITENFDVNSQIKKIFGGFKGTELLVSERENEKTVFDFSLYSDNTSSLHVREDGILDGFILKKTESKNNLSFYIFLNANGRLSNVDIISKDKYFDPVVAGLNYKGNLTSSFHEESSVIENCRFLGRSSPKDGFLIWASNTIIANCQFFDFNVTDNTTSVVELSATDAAGVLEGKRARSMIVNCAFYGCTGTFGALKAKNTIVSSCTFIECNSTKSGGAIYLDSCATVENCFFDKNKAGVVQKVPQDIYCFAYPTDVKIKNNVSSIQEIVDFDETNRYFDPNKSSDIYSISKYVVDFYTDNNVPVGYTLKHFSFKPTDTFIIDKGHTECTYNVPSSQYAATDVLGNNRFSGLGIDVGAQEFKQTPVKLSSKVIVPEFVEDKDLVLTDENLQLTASRDWLWEGMPEPNRFVAKVGPGFHFNHWDILNYKDNISSDSLFLYSLGSDFKQDTLRLQAVLDIDDYGVKIVPNLPKGGTFTTSKSRIYWGQELTLEAEVKHGYTFKEWRFNGEIVGKEPIQTFLAKPNLKYNAVDTLKYSAILTRDICNVTVRVEPEIGGSVQKPEFFLYDSVATLTATPATHFRVQKWTIDGDSVANGTTLDFLPQGDAEIVVYFDSIYYQIDGELADPELTSQVELRGVNRSYASGSQATIEAISPIGVTFDKWSVYKNGSVTPLSLKENPYSFTVDGDYRFVAHVQRDSYIITVGALPELSAEVETDKNSYFYGETATITATIADGFVNHDWQICTSGWTGYSCKESHPWAAGDQSKKIVVLKLPVTSDMVVYANQKVGTISAVGNTTSNNGIIVSQIAENQLFVRLNQVSEPWNLDIFDLRGQRIRSLNLTEQETTLTLPSKAFYIFRFTQGENLEVQKVVVN